MPGITRGGGCAYGACAYADCYPGATGQSVNVTNDLLLPLFDTVRPE